MVDMVPYGGSNMVVVYHTIIVVAGGGDGFSKKRSTLPSCVGRCGSFHLTLTLTQKFG